MISNYIQLLRVNRWTKNLLIFLPAFLTGRLGEPATLQLVIAFFSFSLFTSFTYIINDIQDVHVDRHHPQKKTRPVANHAIKSTTAIRIAIGCLLAGMALSFLLPVHFLWLAGLYIILFILYSMRLKQIAIVNLFIPAFGYIIRLGIGGLIFGVGISSNVMIPVFLLALIIAILNRREDMLAFIDKPEELNRSIRGYTLEFLNLLLVVVTSAFVISYIQFTIYSDYMLRFSLDIAYISILIVSAGLARYLQLVIVYHKTAEPTELVFKDIWLGLITASWVICHTFFIYCYNA